MTIKEMRDRKKELGYSYAQIAELSGVPIGTVQKVLGGITASPRYETLMALEAVLGEKEPSMVQESAFRYAVKRQGQYTVEDYYQMPEERRAELIDGWIYDMAAPSAVHQMIAGLLHARLLDYIMARKGSCLPIIAPIDVQLDCDDKTMVQPDIIVVCDRDKVTEKGCFGAPDLVIEILSPSTRKRDMMTKASKYTEAGVREYWIVDPDKRMVITYNLMTSDYGVYGFDSKVPVAIWEGDCRIDFAAIYEYVRFMYGR